MEDLFIEMFWFAVGAFVIVAAVDFYFYKSRKFGENEGE